MQVSEPQQKFVWRLFRPENPLQEAWEKQQGCGKDDNWFGK